MRANVGSMASWAAMGRATGAVERRARAASTSRGRLRAKRDAMWVRETDETLVFCANAGWTGAQG
jgi:hypothetical protein